MKKKSHGGKRKGAGRKKGVTFKEPTVVMRIPVSKVAEVKKILSKKPQKRGKDHPASSGDK